MPSTETIHSNSNSSNNNNNNNNNSSNSNSQTLTPSLGDNSLDSHLLSSPLAIHASPTAAGGCNNTTTSYPSNEDASSSSSSTTATTMTSSISPQSPSTAATSPTPSSPTNSSPPSSPSSHFSFTQRSGGGGGGGTSHVKRIWESQGLQALWKFKLNDLRNELKNRGLNSSGNKPNIINRLHSQYLVESAPSSSSNNKSTSSSSSSSSQQQQQQQQKSLLSPLSMFEDHGDRSAPSSCSPPNSPTTTITTSSSSSSNNHNNNNNNTATSSTSSSSSSTAPSSSTIITTDSDTSTTAPAPSPPTTTSTSTLSTTSKSTTNSFSPPSSSSSSSQNPTSTTTTISNNPAGNSGNLVKPPSRLPPFVSMGSIPHPSATTGGPFYPSMSIAPPSRPKILVKPPSVIIPPPQPIIPSNMIPTRTTTDKSGASLISRPTSSSASAANSTPATSTAATNSSASSSNGASNGSSSGNGTASNNNTNQRLNTLSARRRVAQKGMSIKSTKPAISASAAVLMNMSDTPMSPPTPRTALSALKIKPPAIIMPKPMTPLTDQSKYMTFSPHSSAQFLPFQKSHSSASRVRALKRRAAAAAAAAASSSSKASSSSSQSGNSGKTASRPYTSGKKLQQHQQHQHHHHHHQQQQQQQMKKRGRPGKSLSKMYDHVPESELISLGPSRSSHVSSGMVRTIDYGSTSGIRQSGGSGLKSGLHHRQQLGSASGSASSSGVRLGGTSSGGGHHQHSRPYAHGARSAETSSSSSSSSESESESDEGDCYDYLVGSDDENFMNDTPSSTSTYHHQHHHQASESASASSSVHHDASDHIESIVPTGAVNLIEDYIANGGASNRKRSFGLDDADFYGDISYSTDASPCKRRKSEDIFDIGADDDDFMSGNAGSAGTGGEDDDEEYDDEPFFFCGITQEVPESIQESNLMEQTMGALQSEYSFEVTINRNGGVHNVEKSVNLLSFMGSGSGAVDDTETRKLSVGGNITLHELTKSIVELFTYDRYGGLGDGLGIDSDSKYSMSLPCGTELCSPDANQSSSSQSAVRSSEDLRVVGAKLGNHDAFYIIFPCVDDPLREFCRFTVRVENIAITSSNDDTDLLLTDEDNDSGLLGGALSDSYLNNYDGDNDSDDGCPSEEENAAQSGDDDMLQLMDSHLLLTI